MTTEPYSTLMKNNTVFRLWIATTFPNHADFTELDKINAVTIWTLKQGVV